MNTTKKQVNERRALMSIDQRRRKKYVKVLFMKITQNLEAEPLISSKNLLTSIPFSQKFLK
jgi:hypothetical protein